MITGGRSSTLPVESLGVVERDHMAGTMRLQRHHWQHRHEFRTACVHHCGAWPRETQSL